MGVRVGAVTDDHGARIRDQRIANVVVDVVMDVEALGGVAELRVVLERGPEQLRCHLFGIHVTEDDGRVVAAELQGDSLEGARRRRMTCLPVSVLPVNATLAMSVVRGDPLAQLVATRQCAEHTGRQQILHQLDELEVAQRGER